MPIYEYACRSCEHSFETMQKASEDPLRDCPQCGEPDLRKLLSAPVFRLKGGGWYETDFKSGGKKNLAGDSGGDGASNGSGGDANGSSSGDSGPDSSAKASPEGGGAAKGSGKAANG